MFVYSNSQDHKLGFAVWKPGVGLETRFHRWGFGGSHREACGLGVLNVRGRRALRVRCVWHRECLTSLPRVHYTTRHVTDTCSSAGTPESTRVHVRRTSAPRPLPPPRGPRGSAGAIAHGPGGPHVSLGPPSRTAVEHGALGAKWWLS